MAERGARLGLLLGALGGAAGCGATGLAWVREAPAPATASAPARASDLDRPIAAARTVAGSIPAPTEQDPQADARPRLSHTVTLGEVDVQSPSVAPSSGAAAVSVTINNYNALSASSGAYGYRTFAYRPGASSFHAGGAAARPSSGNVSGPQAGQSWPAIADHGPSFPYRSAPASPWSRAP